MARHMEVEQFSTYFAAAISGLCTNAMYNQLINDEADRQVLVDTAYDMALKVVDLHMDFIRKKL